MQHTPESLIRSLLVLCIHLLLQNDYTKYGSRLDGRKNIIPLDNWCEDRAVASPQFHFSNIIMQLEFEVIIYVRGMREATFQLYVYALTKIVPWLFVLPWITPIMLGGFLFIYVT